MSRIIKTVALSAVVMLGFSACAGDLTAAGLPEGKQTSVNSQPTPQPTKATDPSSAPKSTNNSEPTDSSEPSNSSEPTSASPEPTSADPTTTESSPSASKAPAILKSGDHSEQVRELQHRLLQLDWFDGKITPDYGAATQAAVSGFQGKRGLAVTGEVDQKTWDSLVGMTRKPTRDEMYNVVKAGPALFRKGDSGDAVRDLQARLKQVGWYEQKVTGTYGDATVAAVKGFQGKRQIPTTGEVDQRTKDKLFAMTTKPTQEELTNKPPKQKAPRGLDQRCMTGRVLCISKSSNSLSWVVDGKVQRTVDVRFGSELTPTREGKFTLYWKSRNHHSTLYNTPMPYAMFFSGGQAVHYSADFAARGYNGASHGCVNVRDKGAIIWIFDQTREGDKVIVYR